MAIGSGKVTNAMLAGSIDNGKLVNSKVTIAGNDVSLGGSLSADTLRTSLGLSNALHFLGITSTTMSDGLTTAAVTIDGNSVTPASGDVVIDSNSSYEYVWTGSAWEALGPDSSYKTLQSPISDSTGSADGAYTSDRFVYSISQNENGNISLKTRSLDTSGTWSGKLSKQLKIKLNHNSTEKEYDGSSAQNLGTIYAPTTSGTANQILVSAGENNAPIWLATASGAAYVTSTNGSLSFGTLGVAYGGTGLTTSTNVNAVVIGNSTTATNAMQTVRTASGAFYSTGQDVKPQFGILPVAQGGTGSTTARGIASTLAAGLKAANNGNLASENFTDTTILFSSSNSADLNNNISTWHCRTADKMKNYILNNMEFVQNYNNTNTSTIYYILTDIVPTSNACFIYGTIKGTKGTTSYAGFEMRFQCYWSGSALNLKYYDPLDAFSEFKVYKQQSTNKICFSFKKLTNTMKIRVSILKDDNNSTTAPANHVTSITSDANTANVNTSTEATGMRIEAHYLPLSGGTLTGSLITEGGITIQQSSNPSGNTLGHGLQFWDDDEGGNIRIYTGHGSTYGSYYWENDAYNGDLRWYCVDANNNYHGDVHITKDTCRLMGAAWNDYAEYRKDNKQEKDTQQPGRCVAEIGDGSLRLTTQRLERGCEIISDTFGFSIGEDKEHDYNTPIASSGRVLAYGYESREEFANHIGWPVCSGPNGTVSIMTQEEEEKYPSRIIGTISEVPNYEEWGTGNIKVNGRVWIRIK